MIKKLFIKLFKFDEQEWQEFYHEFFALLAVFLIGITVVTCCSCRSVKYVPIHNDRTDSTKHYNSTIDSTKFVNVLRDTTYEIHWMVRDTIIRDSVYVIEKADGSKETNKEHFEKIYIYEIDTIYNKKYMEQLREKFQQRIDSLNSIINIHEDKPVLVEKPEGVWVRLKKVLGIIVVLTLITLISYCLFKYKKN